MDPLSIIASTLAIFAAVSKTYDTIRMISGLPDAFEEVNRQVPIVTQILRGATSQLAQKLDLTDEEKASILAIAKPCQEKADKLDSIFKELQKKCQSEGEPLLWSEKIRTTYHRILAGTKAHRVESLMGDILKGVKLLALNQVFQMGQDLTDIEKAIEVLANVEPSLPESEFEGAGIFNPQLSVASNAHGQQYNTVGGSHTFNAGQYVGQTQYFDIDLPIVENAIFESPDVQSESMCSPNTRKEVIDDILKWVENPSEKRLYWLDGRAGEGKSTIARTVCERFSKKNRPIASFFFKKGVGDRGNARRLFTTLAYQLSAHSLDLRTRIKDAIALDPKIPNMAFGAQFEKLIRNPLSGSTTRQVVIVIDALDECEGDLDIITVITVLARVSEEKSVDLRVFITSRPEIPPRSELKKIIEKVKHFVLDTASAIEDDIANYLRLELSMIQRDAEERGYEFPTQWLNDERITKLAQTATPLFIVAATICRFVQNREESRESPQSPEGPVDRLKFVENGLSYSSLGGGKVYIPILKRAVDYHGVLVIAKLGQKTGAFVNLITILLVTSIANTLFIDETKTWLFLTYFQFLPIDPIVAARFRQIVGTAVNTITPLSIPSLQALLSIETQTITRTLSPLHSVLIIPKDSKNPNQFVKPLHLSFRDFLSSLELQRSELHQLWIDEKQKHGEISSNCIRLMSKYLKKNICRLKSHGAVRTDVDEASVSKHISPALKYACRYWVEHSKRSGERMGDSSQVYSFLQKYWLHWLETMSLLGSIFEVIHMIAELHYRVDGENSKSFSAFLHDARRFILQNQALIDDAPLQTYSSCLIFLPETSIIKGLFKAEWVWKSKGEENWSALLQTLEGHKGSVRSVAFSPDGQKIASGSNDGTIKLWDTTTGQVRYILEGHENSVNSVAFSPDDQKIASGSTDRTIKLWDITTEQVRHTFEGHTDQARSVAFSQDSQTIASGSNDGTIKLWDTTTGQVRYTLEGHEYSVNSVAFSPKGQTIASGSNDGTIKLWDTTTGQIHRTLKGHKDWVRSVAFSPDGQTIASGSDDGTIKLWDTATGQVRYTLEGHEYPVNSIAFSSDGQTIASCSTDGTIKLWDTTIKLWDTTTRQVRHKLEGHKNSVTSVAFSPDGQIIASGSIDGTIKLWNTITGQIHRTLKGHKNWITSVAFSPDGQTIASSSNDGIIKLWDTTTAEVRHDFSTSSDTGFLFWDSSGYISNGQESFFYKYIPSSQESSIGSQHLSTSVRVHKQWLARGEENLLWIPDRFRSQTALAVHNNTIALGYSSGSVTIIKFDFSMQSYTGFFDTN